MAKKHFRGAIAVMLAMACAASFGLAACGGGSSDETYTYHTYTSVSPSNWNMLTYQDNNDTQIMDYIHSYFFEYDYDFGGNKYDSKGNILSENIVDGSYVTQYSAATALEDVTTSVAAEWGYSSTDEAYAWKITLRNDLKWDDGTEITAADFVYSMQAQLDPDYFNYRADSYYNSSVVIHNAKNYLFQGGYNYSNMISANYEDDEYTALDDFIVTSDGYLQTPDGQDVYFTLANDGNWGGSEYSIIDWYGWYGNNDIDYSAITNATANDDGYIPVTMDLVDLMSEMIAEIHYYSSASERYTYEGDYTYLEWEEFCYLGKTYDDMEFSEVGIYAASTYELVICLDTPLYLLDDDGGLSYRAAYYLSGLPLVKQDLYEKYVVDNRSSSYKTSTYCSSLASTASWGPYKLTEFQSGKSYTLEKNEYWYGWDMEEFQNQYQTDKIVCETISSTDTTWEMFFLGELDVISINTAHSSYSSSSYAMFTPYSYTASFQVQSTYTSSMASNNSAIILNQKFREALSLGINRSEFTSACTTSSLPGFGLLNSMYYYAVDDGLTYRGSTAAKTALLKTYGFTLNSDGTWTDGTNTYSTLDAAYNAMTGYDLSAAQTLVQEAIAEMEDGSTDYSYYTWYDSSTEITWDSSSTVTLNIVVEDATIDGYDTILTYMQKYVDAITTGSKLEGKVTLQYISQDSNWATYFMGGGGELCMGGWEGAAWDPGYMLGCYLDSNYMYSQGWDTYNTSVTYTLPDGDYDGAGKTLTMSLYDWYACLNGYYSDYYNWAAGSVDDSVRLEIMAMIEQQILQKYFSIPLYYYYSATLHSAKINYISDEYNTFMSYGGFRYITYNYSDTEWDEYVASVGRLESLYKS